jgi:glycosyltransferase involved in cell wall biosynthesis
LSRIRALFVLTDLHGGGAQRVMLDLLRHLPRDEFDLHLALVRGEGSLLQDIPDDVPWHALGARRVRGAFAPLLALIRRLRPDVILSTLYHLNQFLLLMRPLLPRGTRIVIREAITVSQSFRRRGRFGVRTLFLPWIYPTADRIVCQCDYMARDLAEHFRIPAGRMVTIYNPIDVKSVRASADGPANPFEHRGRGPHLVAVGRLDPQKGFDTLISSLPDLQLIEPEAQLWILGDDQSGEVQRDLSRQASAAGLSERVHLVGYVDNPYPYLAHADLFVLSSRYEGLPNVLLEALALGCPVVALDRPGGTREVMELSGQTERLVSELDWQREWFRGRGSETTPDLSAFALQAALSAYADVLRGT